MSMNELQKQTNANIQAKANLIWEIATHLVGLFKPHEYGKVILPMTVLKRFDDALKPTKAAVVEMPNTNEMMTPLLSALLQINVGKTQRCYNGTTLAEKRRKSSFTNDGVVSKAMTEA